MTFAGGPLVVRGSTPSRDVQVGVVSWGVGCAFLPGVFSRISEGYDWIEEEVCERSDDPPSDICGGGGDSESYQEADAVSDEESHQE